MTKPKSDSQEIEILDAQDRVIAAITTERPQWSFDQYTRNRDASGWHWRDKSDG